MAKKLSEEAALAKPKFLTKAERAELALKRRQEEVDKANQKRDEEKLKREALEKELREADSKAARAREDESARRRIERERERAREREKQGEEFAGKDALDPRAAQAVQVAQALSSAVSASVAAVRKAVDGSAGQEQEGLQFSSEKERDQETKAIRERYLGAQKASFSFFLFKKNCLGVCV